MRGSTRLWLVLFLTQPAFSTHSGAAEVVVPLDEKKAWKQGEQVCLPPEQGQVRCGKVKSLTKTEATIELNVQGEGAELLPAEAPQAKPQPPSPKPKPARPKKAAAPAAPEPAAPKPERRTASTPTQIAVTTRPEKVYRFYASAGLDAGIDYVFSRADLQRVLGDSAALGISVLYTNNLSTSPSKTGFGVKANFDYFLQKKNFLGFFLEGSLAYYSLRHELAGQTDRASPVSLAGALHWRGAIKSYSFFFGLGAGVQYVFLTVTNRVTFSGLYPLFTLDIGVPF